jgi:hypothetical protein
MRSAKPRLITGIVVGLFSGLPGAMPVHAADYLVNVNDTAQPVLGFGAQVWAGNTNGQSVLADLDMDFARMQSGVNWFTFPTQPPTDTNNSAGDNYSDMYNYIVANFNGPNGSERWHLPSIKASYIHAQANGIDIILNEFKIANSFLNAQNTRMLDSLVDDYATFWVAQIQYLADHGVYPKYIEMANEPNGTWNGLINPYQYNTLVQQTRALLDARGFTGVGIIGPGLNEIGGTRLWNGFEVADWFSNLDAGAVNALAGWSSHTWDDWAGIDGRIQVFNNATADADPGGNKPVFITEYATAVSTYGGVNYGSPDAGGSATEQSAFAVRTFDNTLALINGGASALILWEAADQTWSNATWGLRRLDGTERPTYLAMEALLTELPEDAVALSGLGRDGDVNTAAVTDGSTLIIAMTNNGGSTQDRELTINTISGLQLNRAVRFVNNNATDITAELNGNTLSVSLPGLSTLTLVLSFTGLPGDLDGDGFVGIADLNIVLGAWNQSVVTAADADPSGDGFVGIEDLNIVLGHWNEGTAPSVVPEPATFWWIGTVGLAACTARRRR